MYILNRDAQDTASRFNPLLKITNRIHSSRSHGWSRCRIWKPNIRLTPRCVLLGTYRIHSITPLHDSIFTRLITFKHSLCLEIDYEVRFIYYRVHDWNPTDFSDLINVTFAFFRDRLRDQIQMIVVAVIRISNRLIYTTFESLQIVFIEALDSYINVCSDYNIRPGYSQTRHSPASRSTIEVRFMDYRCTDSIPGRGLSISRFACNCEHRQRGSMSIDATMIAWFDRRLTRLIGYNFSGSLTNLTAIDDSIDLIRHNDRRCQAICTKIERRTTQVIVRFDRPSPIWRRSKIDRRSTIRSTWSPTWRRSTIDGRSTITIWRFRWCDGDLTIDGFDPDWYRSTFFATNPLINDLMSALISFAFTTDRRIYRFPTIAEYQLDSEFKDWRRSTDIGSTGSPIDRRIWRCVRRSELLRYDCSLVLIDGDRRLTAIDPEIRVIFDRAQWSTTPMLELRRLDNDRRFDRAWGRRPRRRVDDRRSQT